MENSVTLYGASGHGKVIIEILQSNTIPIAAVIDDAPKNTTLSGIEIIKTDNFDLQHLRNTIISIGNNKVRQELSERLQTNFVSAIHPSAIISKSSKIGNGSVVMAGAIINADAEIGNHCIINSGAVIEHDCRISDFVHVSPGVALAGNISVGKGSHIGIGVTVIQGITIGKWAVIGAGTVVIRDVPDFSVVVGNPGKIIKYLPEF